MYLKYSIELPEKDITDTYLEKNCKDRRYWWLPPDVIFP